MARMRNGTVDVSARKTYDLLDEPAGKEYHALIDGALAQCDTAVLSVPNEPLSAAIGPVLELLRPFSKGDPLPGPGGSLQRYRLDRDSAAVFKGAASALYEWRLPGMPADLCLLRGDGSPWLVSIASEKIGYVELSPFEKLLLGRGSPAMAGILAHQGAKDAVLAVFERAFEGATQQLYNDMHRHAEMTAAESREGLVDALRDWLESDEQCRMAVAIDMAAEFGLDELRAVIVGMRRAILSDETLAPLVYGRSAVLRGRWRARAIRQLDRAIAALGPPPPS